MAAKVSICSFQLSGNVNDWEAFLAGIEHLSSSKNGSVIYAALASDSFVTNQLDGFPNLGGIETADS